MPENPTAHLLVDGPDDAPLTVLLSHGAGAGMDHEFLATVAAAWAKAGLRCVRFEFPFMHARREGRRPGPDRMPKLQACFREVVASQPGPIVLAGKSMGGRVATMIADECAAERSQLLGVVVFGYPFHPPGKLDKLRTAHLEKLQTKTLILQGERDTFGTREQVESYSLSPAIELAWLPDGDHSLKPRVRSGFTHEQNLATAIERSAEFARSLA